MKHEETQGSDGSSCAEKKSATPYAFTWLELRVTMEFFQHRYYKINKILLTAIGQWPYQTTRASRGYLALSIFLFSSAVVPQIIALVKRRDDKGFLLETTVPFLFETVCVIKLICYLWNSDKRLTMLNRIRTDWQVWSGDPVGINVLHAYAEYGRIMTTVYGVSICSAATVFMTQPVVLKIIDTLFKNGSEPGAFPFPVDYHYFNEQRYYFYIYIYNYASVVPMIIIMVATDAMLIVYVQHGCGLFAAVGAKLERMGNEGRSATVRKSTDVSNKIDADYDHLVSCIDRHNDALEYAALTETTYTWAFFFVVELNMIILSVTGLQIVTQENDLEETIRFVVYGCAQMFHLFVETFISQALMDHSINIRYYINKGKWYRISLEAQKLLSMMTMRCNMPCKLTAGKICVMSMERFGMVLKTSASYFTLLRSM